MPKPGKLQKLLSNTALKDDLVIEVGGESFTMGDLRAMDSESEGASTADLEAREAKLVSAQSALAQTLQTAADRMGVSIDQLIDGNLEGVTPRRGASEPAGDSADPLADLDPKVLAALEKRFGSSAVTGAVESLKRELADTKKALGFALKTNLDDHYSAEFSKHAASLPEGVKLDLPAVLKYADDNSIKDRVGRYNIQKAVDDLTRDARHKAELAEAEKRGEERARQKALADSVRPGAGAPGAQHMKPPVDDKGRVHSIDHQLRAALEDTDIQRMISGAGAGAA